jgi:anti-sigma regulatory factor (Ser/Thr protein kinase)
VVRDMPGNVQEVCAYGFTEMVNNVRDHSESQDVVIEATLTAASFTMKVTDHGVGIFHKIMTECGLEDERHAVLELTKGKLTTDPERHTGEGIFFTSRMFDTFGILSGGLFLACDEGEDWLLETSGPVSGTAVSMRIHPLSTRTAREVFDRYATDQDDYGFHRTHVVVALAKAEGEKLISRSQAKRILARLDRFKEIVLDFQGVDSIGPAFADEIFRVFRLQHPQVRLSHVKAGEDVSRMIRRALSAESSRSADEPAPSGT